jgi:hypothetical protein
MASKGRLSFAVRAEHHQNGLVKRLFAIAGRWSVIEKKVLSPEWIHALTSRSETKLSYRATESKRSNVVLSADLTTTKDLLEIADGKRDSEKSRLPSS